LKFLRRFDFIHSNNVLNFNKFEKAKLLPKEQKVANHSKGGVATTL